MTSPKTTPRLDRSTWSRAAAPPRIVHLGLGGFHRAHQADFTDRSHDADHWGIAAFTGRRPDAAVELARQEGLFTLITRGPDTDRARIVASISASLDGGRTDVLTQMIAAPDTSIVTLTVTEAAYRLGSDGRIQLDDHAVRQDLARLRDALLRSDFGVSLETPLVRLLAGIERRRREDAGPLAVIPCDNIASGGSLVRAALLQLADEIDPRLMDHVAESVSVVSTTVDRITPRTQSEDRAVAAHLTGYADLSPVVAEPYASWVISGDFPAGRPMWETAGVEFTDDIRPFEQRKLWMLNGAHSLLAYAGLVRGRSTVAEAAEDPLIATWMGDLWADAAEGLSSSFDPGSLLEYREALRERFLNTRLADSLNRIAADGLHKLRVRAVPLVLAARECGSHAVGASRLIASWIVALRTPGLDVSIDEATDRTTAALVSQLHPRLGVDAALIVFIDRLIDEVSSLPGRRTSRQPVA